MKRGLTIALAPAICIYKCPKWWLKLLGVRFVLPFLPVTMAIALVLLILVAPFYYCCTKREVDLIIRRVKVANGVKV